MAGIIGYGAYIPTARLKVDDIWQEWNDWVDTPAVIKGRRGLSEKAVCRWDEDPITMAIAAAKTSLEVAGISSSALNAIYFGSCTNPYASKAAAPVIGESLAAPPEAACADCQFATKSGTVALQICTAMVDSGMANHAMAIGSDALSRHVAPNDPLEYSASCGAAAIILGNENIAANIQGVCSYNTQTPEFFRLDGDRYIKHAGNENEEYMIGYRRHAKACIELYMAKFSCRTSDFAYISLSQPDGRLPMEVAKETGFSEEQMMPGLIAEEIGDCGSASSLLSLASVLDQAKPRERILLVSYGFGAGCDAIGLETTDLLETVRHRRNGSPNIRELMSNKEYISYSQYLRQERKLIQEYI